MQDLLGVNRRVVTRIHLGDRLVTRTHWRRTARAEGRRARARRPRQRSRHLDLYRGQFGNWRLWIGAGPAPGRPTQSAACRSVTRPALLGKPDLSVGVRLDNGRCPMPRPLVPEEYSSGILPIGQRCPATGVTAHQGIAARTIARRLAGHARKPGNPDKSLNCRNLRVGSWL
jgi:hypothetical protein